MLENIFNFFYSFILGTIVTHCGEGDIGHSLELDIFTILNLVTGQYIINRNKIILTMVDTIVG